MKLGLDPLGARIQQLVGGVQAHHGRLGVPAVALGIEDPDELGEVVADRGTQVRLAGAAPVTVLRRVPREPDVPVGSGCPRVEPLVPARNRAGGAHEVVVVDAVGD